MEGKNRIHINYNADDAAYDDDDDDADDGDADDDEVGALVKGCIRASPHQISAAAPNSINLTPLSSSSSSSSSSSQLSSSSFSFLWQLLPALSYNSSLLCINIVVYQPISAPAENQKIKQSYCRPNLNCDLSHCLLLSPSRPFTASPHLSGSINFPCKDLVHSVFPVIVIMTMPMATMMTFSAVLWGW